MSDLDVYYVARPGSDAHQRLVAYVEGVKDGRHAAERLARRLKAKSRSTFLVIDGRISGFSFAAKPERWVSVRGHAGWYFPKRLKANKTLLEEIRAVDLGSPSGIAKCLFGKVTHYFEGLCLRRGVGFELIGDRYVVSFGNEKHAATYKSCWPDGFARVRASVVMRWREDEREQCAAKTAGRKT